MLGAMSDWVYNRNPTESLHFEGPLKELKDDLASGKKARMTNKPIQDNPHPPAPALKQIDAWMHAYNATARRAACCGRTTSGTVPRSENVKSATPYPLRTQTTHVVILAYVHVPA